MKSLQRQQKQCGILISQAEKKEQDSLVVWQQQKQQVVKAEEQLTQLKEYAKGQSFTGNITPQQLLNRAHFSHQLIQVINTQERAISQLKEQCERAHQVYIQSQNKRKTLEKYLGKLNQKFTQQQLKQEQKLLDEWVSNNYSNAQ